MPLTPSNAYQPGWQAPAFSLPEPLTGKQVNLGDFTEARAILVAFISNVCPSVKLINEGFNQFAKDYAARGLQVIAINSNAQEIKAGETTEGVAAAAREQGYVFPYLRDESQQVAAAYDAACTPDFYLLDSQHRLYYHGQFDDARPNNGAPVTGRDLREAVDLLLAGKPAPALQKNSIGCNIKWRDGDDHGVRQPAAERAAA